MGRRDVLRRLERDGVISCLMCWGKTPTSRCGCGGSGQMTVAEALSWVDVELEVLLRK